jgi:hypothetical protein
MQSTARCCGSASAARTSRSGSGRPSRRSSREIDELPLEDIHARIAALEAAEAEGASTLPWMEAVWRFHELTHAALVAKRWIGGKTPPEELAGLPAEARPWRDDLARIARPPDGRLSSLVLERLAGELGITPDEASALVFPWSRVSRGRGLRRRGR